jgi:uncharacterized LabA/DUF88 family protein
VEMPTQEHFFYKEMRKNQSNQDQKTIQMALPHQKIAILIDGGFFIKRYFKIYTNEQDRTPQSVAKNLYTIAHRHVGSYNTLYRIFYYDSIPFEKKIHNPIPEKVIDFRNTNVAKFRNDLFFELKRLRKLALRLGYLKDSGQWSIRSRFTKDLIKGKITVADLKDNDIEYNLRQKGIDIRIGVDIASLALKRFVDRIVLISGDADFVPAAKLARREGIDFVLDPMWNSIDDSLFEHIDGLSSKCPKPCNYR